MRLLQNLLMEHHEHERHYRQNQKDADKRQSPMLIELLQISGNLARDSERCTPPGIQIMLTECLLKC
jgi:hypothetical protein